VSRFFQELVAYVGFGGDDTERLRAVHPVLEPCFGTVATRFYEAVWTSPSASAFIEGPVHVERLCKTLVGWMSSGLLGPHDEGFYESRARIGRRHEQLGLAPHHLVMAMNVLRTKYHEQVIASATIVEPSATLRSINRLLDVELAIMLHDYQRRSQTDKIVAMQTMSAGLAHEVRNPLNAAKLQLQVLERRLRRDGDDPKLTEPTDLAQKEIERLTALLDDFLTFARPSALQGQEADVATIVRNVIELEHIAAAAAHKELQVVVVPTSLVARCDALKLEQIVLHLVRNAIEAVEPGGHVTVELLVDEGAFVIRIQDDGPGIPDDVRRRIYEPFFSMKSGGTGLGMSIVHSLVVLHGGTVEIDTSERGTRFDVRIPLRV
jgi:signal transduction histidine kinase